jgi:hypothetical protein
LGSALKRAIADAASSYRVPPPISYELNFTPDNAARAVGLLLDVLTEDAPCLSARCPDYDVWKAEVAANVREYVTIPVKSHSSERANCYYASPLTARSLFARTATIGP